MSQNNHPNTAMSAQLVELLATDRADAAAELLSRGAKLPDAAPFAGLTTLQAAVLTGSRKCVDMLLDGGADPLEAGDPNKELSRMPPAHLAASKGDTQMCLHLIDRGVPIDHQSANGQTMLHCAAFGKNLQTVTSLLERGADVSIKSNDQLTPLSQAASLPVEPGKKGQPALSGDLDRVMLALIAYGADASEAQLLLRKTTPVEAAAFGGFPKKLAELVVQQPFSRSALSEMAEMAAFFGHQDCAQCLRARSAAALVNESMAALDSRQRKGLARVSP